MTTPTPATNTVSILREIRNALQFANDTPGGPICDTIWMMDQPQTLFDFIDEALDSERAAIQPAGDAVHQYHKAGCIDWYDGYPDHEDGGGPYESRTLFAAPVPAMPAAPSEASKQGPDWTEQDQQEQDYFDRRPVSAPSEAVILMNAMATRARALDTAAMELAANLCRLGSILKRGVDYVPRDAIMSEVVDWRRKYDDAPKVDVAAIRALQGKPEAQAGEMEGKA